jgi:GntR family transcriptional regulator
MTTPISVGYHQIATWLRDRVMSGELPADARVPGEKELMTLFGVEQPTARRALDVLKNEGLIVARRGSGTYVREFRPVRRSVLDRGEGGAARSVWRTHDDNQMRTGGVRVADEPVPDTVARVLDIPRSSIVRVHRSVCFLEDRPIQLTASYHAMDPATGPAPVRFREELRVRMPTSDESDRLTLPQGTPVVEITRTAYAADDHPVELSTLVLDSNSYILEYHFASR